MNKLNFYIGLKLLSLSILFTFSSCHKEADIRDFQEPGFKNPITCSDGIFNNGELDKDCGGTCANTPCSSFTPTCTVTDNTASVSSMNFTFSFVSVDTTSISNEFSLTGNSSNGDITIRLNGQYPRVSRAYYVGSGGVYDYGTASVRINTGFSYFSAETGSKLFVNVSNGKIKVTFCAIRFQWSANNSYYNGTGNLSL